MHRMIISWSRRRPLKRSCAEVGSVIPAVIARYRAFQQFAPEPFFLPAAVMVALVAAAKVLKLLEDSIDDRPHDDLTFLPRCQCGVTVNP